MISVCSPRLLTRNPLPGVGGSCHSSHLSCCSHGWVSTSSTSVCVPRALSLLAIEPAPGTKCVIVRQDMFKKPNRVTKAGTIEVRWLQYIVLVVLGYVDLGCEYVVLGYVVPISKSSQGEAHKVLQNLSKIERQ